MVVVTIRDAKAQLSQLLARAEAGEEIIIARGGKPAIRLVPLIESPHNRNRTPGRLKGEVDLPDSFFFDPLPEDELKAWEGTGRNAADSGMS